MLRFKHFSGSSSDLERAINEWLEQFEPEVTHMMQSSDGKGSLIISFLFEESFRGQELRMALERGVAGATNPAMPSELVPDEPLHVSQ
jgi:hypothetical protein